MAEKSESRLEAQQRAHEFAKATVKSEIERRHTEAMKKKPWAFRCALQNTDGDMVTVAPPNLIRVRVHKGGTEL
jgi:hypothetical protein